LRQRFASSAFALDEQASAAAGDGDEVGLLQAIDELREAVRTVSAFVEGRIQLQHGGLQQAELWLDTAAFEHLQGALDERHGLRKIESRRTFAALLLLL
jgi:hypothetical protein